MGREIRRVPPNWEHPKRQNPYTGKEEYQPLHKRSYRKEIAEWIENHNLWLEGKHPDQIKIPETVSKYKFYAEWGGEPPEACYYFPEWDEEPTWYQVYETVSEGTPVTPPFATQDELVDYLATHGTFWDDGNPWSREAAERFVKSSG